MSGDLKAGTAGGTLLGMIYQLPAADMLHTAIMAATGAVISFWVSRGLQWLVRRMKKEKSGAQN